MCGVTQWANLKSAAHIIHYSAIPDMVSGLTMGGAELKRYCEQWTQFRASWCCQVGTVRLGEPSPLPTQHVTMLWPFCTLQFMTHSGTISDVPINIFCRKDKQVEFQSCVMLQAAGIIRTGYHHSSRNLALASSRHKLSISAPDECFSSVSYFHSIFKDCQKYPWQTLAGTDEDIF